MDVFVRLSMANRAYGEYIGAFMLDLELNPFYELYDVEYF